MCICSMFIVFPGCSKLAFSHFHQTSDADASFGAHSLPGLLLDGGAGEAV